MKKPFLIAVAALLAAGCTRQAGPVPRAAGAQAHAARGGGKAVARKEDPPMIQEKRSGEWTPGLSEQEQKTLFAIGEDTLAWCVNRTGKPFSFEKYTLTDKLKTERATFVTLKTADGRLRGCIGSLAPEAELYKSVHDNAVNAALRDHRFRPVSPAELPRLVVHISILSPITPIPSLDKFKLGEHGIILVAQSRRAVYLPEVAPEQGWTREETLTSLSRKAGLPGTAWKRNARFLVFSSVVLSKHSP